MLELYLNFFRYNSNTTIAVVLRAFEVEEHQALGVFQI